MKKIISLILVVLTVLGTVLSLGGCNQSTQNNKKISVVATVFPLYDWAKQVLGENAANTELSFIFDNGADPHSYQPTADDFAKITTCDLLIFSGGESDKWIEDTLKTATNKNMKILNALDILDDAVIKDEHGVDEHFWLSLKNAQTICTEISKLLGEIDIENADKYTQNAKNYNQKLNDLDNNYKSTVSGAKFDTLIFADRFPFRYLLKDYGISHYAAFDGCSAESEAGVKTITLLASKLKELALPAVLTIDRSDKSIAKTVIAAAGENVEILTLYSLQTVTSSELESGNGYLEVMQDNLKILKKALKG